MAFKFIAHTEETISAADATALSDNELSFGNITTLDYKILKLKLGNSNAARTTFTLSAAGTASANGTSLKDYVFFTTDKFNGKGYNVTYGEVSVGDTSVAIVLEPNEVSPVIWAVFACHPDFISGAAEIKLKVVEA